MVCGGGVVIIFPPFYLSAYYSLVLMGTSPVSLKARPMVDVMERLLKGMELLSLKGMELLSLTVITLPVVKATLTAEGIPLLPLMGMLVVVVMVEVVVRMWVVYVMGSWMKVRAVKGTGEVGLALSFLQTLQQV